MRSLILALQFLSIIPLRVRGEVTEEHLLRSTVVYPLVGFFLGGLLVGTDILFSMVFSSSLTSAFVLLVMVIFTGALHLDGLSDTFDALACRGTVERRLEAMRDSSAGPVGMVAVLFVLGMKFLALEELSNLSYYERYAGLLFMPVVGRWALLAGMYLGRPSRADGLGKIFIGRIGSARFLLATVLGLGLFALVSIVAGGYAPRLWYLFGVMGFVQVFALVGVFTRLFGKSFGGHSGDTLGAVCELSELLFLLWVSVWSVWSRLYI